MTKGLSNKEIGQINEKVDLLAKQKGLVKPKFEKNDEKSILKIIDFLFECIEKQASLSGGSEGGEDKEEGRKSGTGGASLPPPPSDTTPFTEVMGKATNSALLKLNSRVSYIEDSVDNLQQRSRKGGIIINSPVIKNPVTQAIEKESLFGFRSEEESENLPKIIDLLNKRYSTHIKCEDVSAAHFINDSAYYICFSNRNPMTSTWGDFVKEMRRGGPNGERSLNIFACFDLTKTRLALCSTARQLKKEGKISRFSTDANGAISVEKNGVWVKITSHFTKEGNYVPTYSIQKLQNI